MRVNMSIGIRLVQREVKSHIRIPIKHLIAAISIRYVLHKAINVPSLLWAQFWTDSSGVILLAIQHLVTSLVQSVVDRRNHYLFFAARRIHEWCSSYFLIGHLGVIFIESCCIFIWLRSKIVFTFVVHTDRFKFSIDKFFNILIVFFFFIWHRGRFSSNHYALKRFKWAKNSSSISRTFLSVSCILVHLFSHSIDIWYTIICVNLIKSVN